MANTKISSHVLHNNAVTSAHIANGAIHANSLSNITSAHVAEGSNLYFTNARARSSISVTGGNLAYDASTGVLQLTDGEIRDALSAGTGVTYSSGQFSIGQAVGTSDTVTFGNITTAGYLRGPASFTIDPAAHGDDTGTVVIAGNLQVDGTTTTINSTTMTVDDLNLTLASGAASAAAANGAGLTVDGASASITYVSASDSWNLNKATIAARLNSNTLNDQGNTANIIYRSSSKTIVGNNATALVVQDGGNVGIGFASNPSAKFEVQGGTTYPAAKFSRDGGSAATQGYTQIGHSNLGYSGGAGADTYIISEHGFGFAVNAGTNAFTIKDTGNAVFHAADINITADDARLLIEETDGTDIAVIGDITGAGVGGMFLYNHGGTATTQLRADSASTIGHGLNVGGNVTLGSSTAGNLQVGSSNSFEMQKSGVNAYINQSDSGPIIVRMGSGFTERLRINNAGNIGLGVVPNANWSSSYRAIDAFGGATLQFEANSTRQGQNFYGYPWKYKAATTASSIAHTSTGDISMQTAPAGSADAAITWTSRLHIQNTGNVGIGESSPNRRIVVKSADNATNSIQFQSPTTGNAAGDGVGVGMDSTRKAFLWNYEGNDVYLGGTAAGVAMTIDGGSGNVGIGTDNPYAKAHIQISSSGGAGAGTAGALWLRNGTGTANNSASIFWGPTASAAMGAINLVHDDHTNNYGSIKFDTRSSGGYSTKMTITKEGTVGIGDPSPPSTVKLAIQGDGVVLRLDGTNNVSRQIMFRNVTTTNPGQIKADGSLSIFTEDANTAINIQAVRNMELQTTSGGGSAGHIIFTSHNTEVMRMDGANMRLGVGTDTPDAKFEVAGEGGTLTNELALTAINKTISEQARDVFIYDTSKDSDGGAWRHRTQHTSWYNEASSSTRSSTKKFPAVAIIVSTSSKVTIYDGDYTDTPMWMEFSLPGHSVASNWASTSIGLGSPGFQASTPMDVAMLNGQLVIGCQSGSELGGYLVNFINELMIDMVKYGSANDQFYHKFGDISQRNVSTTRAVGQRYSYGQEDPVITGRLSSGIVNDVDMTILPDAPINVTTGLPEPTIILATNEGINIIRDDGAMAFITAGAGSAYNGTRYVRITDTHNLIFEQDSGDRAQFFISLPDASRTTQTSDGSITDKVVMKWYETGGNHVYAYFHGGGIQNAVAMSGDEHALVASDTSELTLVDPYIDSKTQTSVAYIGADYNTGWMTGASHLASLCGKVTGNLTPVDVLGGIGNFTSSGLWSFASGWSLSGNVATGTSVTAYLTPATNGVLTQGEQYAVTVTQSAYTSGALYIYVGTGAPGGQNHYTNLPSSVGTFTFVLSAFNTNFGIYGANYTGTIDNVTVVKCEADRSPHEDGLIPFGSVGRTLVNTNAELVGYGPFSSANYLEHKGFTFGSIFIVSFWMKPNVNFGCVFHTAQGTRVEFAGGSVRFTMYDGNTTIDLREQVYPLNEWTHVVCVRNGDTGKLYVNGRFVESQTVSNFGSLNNDGSKLTVGDRSDSASEPFDGKVSLFRITKGGTISDEQVYKYYTQERPMFAVGAQVTIGGTDDSVYDLAYDSDTKLLHIGNGNGKSTFSGLNMVDFTSDAVGTTIAASGGMIVED